MAGPLTGGAIGGGKSPDCCTTETGGAGVCEFEPRLRKAVWGLGMETHEAQRVCKTGYSHSWVPHLPYV